MPSNHLILCHPLLLLPSIFPSIRVFSSEPVLPIRWPKYWNISFSISPSNEYSGLISFRMDCFEPSIGWLQTNSFVVNFSLNPLDRRMPCLELPEGSPWSSDVFFSLHTLFCLISTSAELPYKEMGTASWSTLGNAGSCVQGGCSVQMDLRTGLCFIWSI